MYKRMPNIKNMINPSIPVKYSKNNNTTYNKGLINPNKTIKTRKASRRAERRRKNRKNSRKNNRRNYM